MTDRFCTYCGAKTIDESSKRTYCISCGEDLITQGQFEELQHTLICVLPLAWRDHKTEEEQFLLEDAEKLIAKGKIL